MFAFVKALLLNSEICVGGDESAEPLLAKGHEEDTRDGRKYNF